MRTSLDLNEKWRIFLRNELEQFRHEYPDSQFEINCWVDELVSDTAKILDDYLVQHNCPTRLKTGGDIIGKNRTTFFRLAKREIL